MQTAVSRHTDWTSLEELSSNSVLNFHHTSQQRLVFPLVLKFSTLSCFVTGAWHNASRVYLEEIIRNSLNHYPLTDYWHTDRAVLRMPVMVKGYCPRRSMLLYLIVVFLLSTQLVTLCSLYIPPVAFWRLNLVLQQSCGTTGEGRQTVQLLSREPLSPRGKRAEFS